MHQKKNLGRYLYLILSTLLWPTTNIYRHYAQYITIYLIYFPTVVKL